MVLANRVENEAIVRSVNEIDRLLAEAESELARLSIRRAELLSQIVALQQEKHTSLQTLEAPLQS
ncbi:MAG: hypothetical protein JW850_15705, partial [Thermoflexales bacterium]|nr:hypothetical protein [Thermoflexales bacterium]